MMIVILGLPAGGSHPPPHSFFATDGWNLGASIVGAVSQGPLLCKREVISCEPSQREMIRQQAEHSWHTQTIIPREYISAAVGGRADFPDWMAVFSPGPGSPPV